MMQPYEIKFTFLECQSETRVNSRRQLRAGTLSREAIRSATAAALSWYSGSA